jgi:intracellular sulfur oxidation DsrE/DsrF family protein
MTTPAPLLLAAVFLFSIAMPPHVLAAEPKLIPLEKTKDIKAVYQVSEPTEHDGLNKGLFYARKVLGTYTAQGIPASEIDLHLVYHSGAIVALLDDAAYQRLSKKSGPNPNAALLAEVIKAGVHVEVCADTMKQKNVQNTDLLPGVDIVGSAFPRLIDLQSSGYSYIKFE